MADTAYMTSYRGGGSKQARGTKVPGKNMQFLVNAPEPQFLRNETPAEKMEAMGMPQLPSAAVMLQNIREADAKRKKKPSNTILDSVAK